MKFWCSYFNYVFLNYCVSEVPQKEETHHENVNLVNRFQVSYQWSYLNYTWSSVEHYQRAIQSGYYIAKHNAPVGMKIYKNRMFLSVPRYRTGVPATLVYFDMNLSSESSGPLLTPFPSWSAYEKTSCFHLQSVQSMEIDSKGILWVIDGVRTNDYTQCPTKLVLFDLNSNGAVIHSYIFPQEISLRDGGFLNDLVVDETDGGFAYITDNSQIDPGIIVYSRWKDHSWKLRDISMFSESVGKNFPVENIIFDLAVPVDGIALSTTNKTGDKTLFFSALTAFTLYSISTNVIKNEELVKTGTWRDSVRNVGQKISQTDGMIIDENSNMYLTMMPLYGVAQWNINTPLLSSKLIDQNQDTMIWPDGFAFDQKGYLYVICNKVFNYIDPRNEPVLNGDTQFRVLRLFTGTRSYLYI